MLLKLLKITGVNGFVLIVIVLITILYCIAYKLVWGFIPYDFDKVKSI